MGRVLYEAHSQNWFHVLCVCSVYRDICNLDDVGVHVMNGIYDFRKGVASSVTL